jgi:hypothetical protein
MLDRFIDYTDKQLDEIFNSYYHDISNLVETSISLNTDYADLTFLNEYFTMLITHSYTLLNYLGEIRNKEDIKRFVDMSAALIYSSLYKYYVSGIHEALLVFIKQLLNVLYDKFNYNIFILSLNDEKAEDGYYENMNIHHKHMYKLMIEPIAYDEEYLMTEEESDIFIENLITLLAYTNDSNDFISISILKDNLWLSSNEYLTNFELEEDNILPNFFESQPALLKAALKLRYNLLVNYYNIDNVIDYSDNIDLSEEDTEQYKKYAQLILNNFYDNKQTQNIIKEYNAEEDSKNNIPYSVVKKYNNIVSEMFTKLFMDSLKNTSISNIYNQIENFSDKLDIYNKTVKNIKNGVFTDTTISKLFKYYKYNNEDNFVMYEDDAPDLTLEEEKELFDQITKLAKIEENDDTITTKTKVEFKVAETNPAAKSDDGFKKFIADYHKPEDIKIVCDFTDYVNSILSLYTKYNKINAKVIRKVFKSFNRNNLKLIEIINNKQKYILIGKVEDTDTVFRFAISKDNGTIKSVEVKDE